MVSTLSSTEPVLRVELLRKFRSTAQQLKDLIGTSVGIPVSPSSPYNGPVPALVLPFPNDIVLTIEDMGLPNHLCQKMKSKLTEKVFQSQRVCLESYKQTCRELSGPLISPEYISSLANTFRKIYDDQQISKFRAQILAAKSTFEVVNKGHFQETKRPTFNSEYTPLLEKYFEHNAYPSRPDRILLARKSSMTERQIEVWFQNHRNRAKKEGIPLKRMSSPQSSAIEFLEQKAVSLSIALKTVSPSENDIDMPEKLNEAPKAAGNPSNDFFPSPTPSHHTFPTPYRRNPQDSFVDPSPQQEGTSRFPPPNWPRKPAMQPPSPLSIDMEEFTAMFASKLSIRRGSSMKSTNTTFKTRAWFFATVTIPSPAPHPALIRVKDLPRPSIPTPTLRTTALNHSTVTNISDPSLSSTSQASAFKPRKMAPFPFRTPQRTSLPHIESSLSVRQPFASRTSSFASVSPSQSRSSSASTGSTPEPITPPHSPTIDSCGTREFVQDLTSDTYVDLFADIAEPQFDFSQNLDHYLNNVDIFTSKHLPISIHNFPYLDPLFATT